MSRPTEISRPIITLTTDFGEGSPYVAEMKGVILTINPQVTIVDITHAIPPQHICRGAVVLDDVCRRFPSETIHIAVVDPGVGTERAIVLADLGGQRFIAPDNGLLWLVAGRRGATSLRQLTNTHYWLPEVSATFHGRDIMAPVAAHLSLGADAELLGPTLAELSTLDFPRVEVQADRLLGSIIAIDSFGNAISNITAETLARVANHGTVRVRCRTCEITGLSRTYADRSPGTPITLIGSTGRLEIAVVGGNAADAFDLQEGHAVQVFC